MSVQFLSQKITTKADENGQWQINLNPLAASYTPTKLIVEAQAAGQAKQDKLIINKVLVGEVWLSSGQSNMRFTLEKSLGGKDVIKQAKNKHLRLLDFTNKTFYPTKKIFNVKALEQLRPDNYFHSDGWQVSNEENSKNFSAVAYHFAHKLQQELDVPVGIINVSVGGTLMENYISKEKLASIDALDKLNGNWLDNIPQWCAKRAKYNLSDWLKKYPNTLPNHPFKPSFLFDAGIKPLVPYAIKGFIWYQGESNAPSYKEAKTYDGEYALQLSKLKFKALISDWREQWKNKELPFYFVQLPGLNRPWAPFRQMQSTIVNEVANTHMAITYDLGHPTDVHPKNKKPVGKRLARLALKYDYDKTLIAHGPVYSHVIADKKSLKVFFKKENLTFEANSLVKVDLNKNKSSSFTLSDNSNTLKGFEIAGSDGVFVSAQAKVKGDHIIVNHHNIIAPVHVRYAWFDDPKNKANLANEAKLPAAPYSSDLVSNRASSQISIK